MTQGIKKYQVVIIGGGPAGLSGAIRLYDQGIEDILILEREHQPGGILRQCIHDGFGLTRFKESLSGPEYAQRLIDEIEKRNIEIINNCTAIDLTEDKLVSAVSKTGFFQVKAEAVVLAMGCRERTRGALSIPGSRPSGVWNAGVAQSYINLYNIMVGKRVVILGSGDIGLIMARRFSLEGAEVLGVYEILPFPSGLPRNVEQCLNDYDIPLYLSHTVIDVHGRGRIEAVTVAEVDQNRQVIPGTEKKIDCDTLVLSVGLIPENELSLSAGVELDPRTGGARVDENCQTNIKGIFAVGNVLHVHDLVDFVSEEAEAAANSIAEYLAGELPSSTLSITCTKDIGHVIPQKFNGKRDFILWLRVRDLGKKVTVQVKQGEHLVARKFLPKALPAEMIQIPIKKENILPHQEIEVSIK